MQPKVYVNKVFELGTCYSVSISVNFKDISVTQSATIADSNPEIIPYSARMDETDLYLKLLSVVRKSLP